MKRREFLKSLKDKSEAELKGEARQRAEAEMKMGFRRVSSTLKETHLIKENRRERARILTELSARRKASAKKTK